MKWICCSVLLVLTVGFGAIAPAGADTSGDATPLPESRAPRDTGVAAGESFRVLWTVAGYVAGRSADMGEHEAKGLLFAPLDIQEQKILFGGSSCLGVSFSRETVEAESYLLERWGMTRRELGIGDKKLTVIRTNCDLPGFREYVQLGDLRLVVPMKGVFFFFEPAIDR